jgi:hypothetical protein
MNMYDTVTLLAVITQLIKFDPFLLNLFFPNVVEFNTREIALDKIAKNLKLAPFVSPMVAGKARTSDGYKTTAFIPAYLKPKAVVDPSRVLRRVAGEQLGGALSNESRRDMIIADILMENALMIAGRLEWMAAQALLTGKVIVSGEDYPTQEVDFGRTGTLTKTLTGSARWGQSGVKPLDDIETWAAQLEAPVTDIVMDGKAWTKFRKDDDVKAALDTRRGSRTELETAPDPGRNYSYKGKLGSDIDVWVYNGVYTDDAGATQKFMPDNRVIMGSPALEGHRAFGAILSPSAGYQAMESFPRHFISQDPEVEYVETQSAPLIIPGRPNASIAINVDSGS